MGGPSLQVGDKRKSEEAGLPQDVRGADQEDAGVVDAATAAAAVAAALPQVILVLIYALQEPTFSMLRICQHLRWQPASLPAGTRGA